MEDVEERIKEILKEHGRMRSTELERMIVEDEGICAKKTFYKKLDNLKFSLDYNRNEISKYEVWYEHEDFFEHEENLTSFFNGQIKEYNNEFKKFTKIKNKLTDKQKAYFFNYLLDYLDYLETIAMSAKFISHLNRSITLKIIVDTKINELRNKLFITSKKFLSNPEMLSTILTVKGGTMMGSKITLQKIIDNVHE